ncbi:MAG: type II secretion system F family protein [Actinomycetota bacterium]
MITLVAALAVGGGLAFLCVAVMLRARERVAEIAAVLELPFGERDVPLDEHSVSLIALLEPGVQFANRALEKLKAGERIRFELNRARIPLRPGEYVLVTAASSIAAGIVVWLLTGQIIVAFIAFSILVWASWRLVVMGKVERRRKAFEAQLPEALSIIASSLEAGHTFQRAIQMMVDEAAPPLSEEFGRVLAEASLGDPLMDAMGRMSDRLQIRDFAWVVQAIRIHQTVGGKLGELLMTLADFMRAREEIRREVQVLTAEGRLSAYVLGALPVFEFMVIKTVNPEYLKPMFHGGGLVALIIAACSVLFGIAIIKRLAQIEV